MAPVSTHARASRRGGAAFFLGALCLWGTGMLACGPSAPGSTRAHEGQLGLALSGAQLERGYSGTLALITVTREQVGLCTATLLAPNLVATARHCIAPSSAEVVRCSEDRASFSPPYSPNSFWVNHSRTLSGPLQSFGLLPLTGGSDEFVPVSDVFVPDTDDVCGGDLALLLLSTELDADEAAPLAPRLDEPVERGDSYTAVGFGDTLEEGGQGTRRSRTGLEVNCTPEDCDALGSIEPTEFQGGEGVCSGDSGGPALDAEGRVVGIASRSEGCTRSVYSTLSSWRDFIREVAARAARTGGYPAPEWLVEAPPRPEPPEPEPAAVAAPEESVTPEPSPTPPEEEASGAATDVTRPLAASQAGGGSGCSVTGSSLARRRQPPLALLSFCLGLLALRGRRLRVHK
ncbi:MAG: trypsin-like serine protease [Deltaproteobacteria bacterium]